MPSPEQLRDDALAIWRAGVAAVDSSRLVREFVRTEDHNLWIGQRCFPRESIDRIVVVGAGKAGAGMAQGLEQALGPAWMDEKHLEGWINVPADCVRQLQRIRLHAARPAGHNEPTEAGVEGARQILELVQSLTPDDLCLCLLSGGGSALLPSPIEGVTLADKQAITRHLSGAGANIVELNTVRKQLSGIKGGNLARACKAGALETLIISDVIGDPLDIIASGPTVPDPAGPEQALEVLERFGARVSGASPAVWEVLRRRAEGPPPPPPGCVTREHVIGNNATAVAAAGREARRRGYRVQCEPAQRLEGPAEQVGTALIERGEAMRGGGTPYTCLVSGGEPTVDLAPADCRGDGGRNQQLVLAALQRLVESSPQDPCRRLVLLSGGTDGEDGPTDAAGAWIGELLDRRIDGVWDRGEIADSLARNDAYHFFQQRGGLLKTGPTHTNVCDLRVLVTDAPEDG